MTDADGRGGDYVVLPRDALFAFLGQVALPPWPRRRSAVLAARMIEWVDRHDLADDVHPFVFTPKEGC